MHMDMHGAATVLGAMAAMGRLRPKVNVVACVALAENAIGAKAVKPNAILRSAMGMTVEVGNTDAEGRLCLGDAIWYVQEHHSPDTVIDVATLTGACVVALGEYTAGLFANNDHLAEALADAGDGCFERCWRLPILPEHTEELKGGYADLRSIGAGREGGSCTAAAFLGEFVRDGVAWAHLDIAGAGMYVVGGWGRRGEKGNVVAALRRVFMCFVWVWCVIKVVSNT